MFRSGRGHHQAQGRACGGVSVLFKFMLPPPTLEEGKLEGFFAHFSLGQIIVIPEALSHEGFFPVSAHSNAQFGGHRCIRYRCVSPFISYNDSDEPRFPGFGGRCRDRCNLLTKHKDNTFRPSGSRTHPVMSDPWSQTEILRKK